MSYLHNNNPYANHPYYINPRQDQMNNQSAGITSNKHTDIINTFRRLWFEHIIWTRSVITSTASDNPDLADTVARLLQNPGDFAAVLMPYYGAEGADKFKTLLTEHLAVAADLLAAHKARDLEKAISIREKWYQNGVEIAELVHALNPLIPENEFKRMMGMHLNLTEDEMLLRLDGNYKADIKQFDLVQQEALKMADIMSYGLIRQFNL